MNEENKIQYPQIHSGFTDMHTFIFEDGKGYTIITPFQAKLSEKLSALETMIAEFRKAIKQEQDLAIERAKKEAEEFEKSKEVSDAIVEEVSSCECGEGSCSCSN